MKYFSCTHFFNIRIIINPFNFKPTGVLIVVPDATKLTVPLPCCMKPALNLLTNKVGTVIVIFVAPLLTIIV
jgi:hypothetical protein